VRQAAPGEVDVGAAEEVLEPVFDEPVVGDVVAPPLVIVVPAPEVVLGVLFPKMLTQDFVEETVTVAAKALAEVPAIWAYFCLTNCTAAFSVSMLK
jgi:hypothetical protein